MGARVVVAPGALGCALCVLVFVGLIHAQEQALPPAAEAPSAPGASRRDMVAVEGDRFVVRGAPFRFVGANVAIMHGPRHRAAVEVTLDAAAADGLSVVRVWALGEQSAEAPPWARDYAFRLGPDGWLEESFVHLDRVLAAAHQRGLRVIVVLGNRWADYGGVPQYLAWGGHGVPSDPAGAPSILALPAFFADAALRARYREHLRRVVGRTSSVTGLPYRDDPTIFAWEIINESDAPLRSRDVLVDWTREMAAEIHRLDPHHLVGAGHIGYVTRAQRETWLAVHRLPEIDYADAHAYPTQYEHVRSLEELDDFIDDHAQLAHHVLHKPLVWGEIGFTTRTRAHRRLSRVRWWDRFLRRSAEDRVDGALAWIYASSTERPREHGVDVDGPEVARTRDVRDTLARHARLWAERPGVAVNPRLGEPRGETPIWRTERTLRGPGRAHRARRVRNASVWSFAPAAFARASTESGGRWDEGAVDHLYASGTGAVEYRIETAPGPTRAWRRASVRLRASSELPGAGEGRVPEDASEIRVSIDGVELGRGRVVPDDGLGAWIELVSEDPALLDVLSRPGQHTLRIGVLEGPHANGLCLYGQATGRPLPDDVGELPGRIELRAER